MFGLRSPFYKKSTDIEATGEIVEDKKSFGKIVATITAEAFSNFFNEFTSSSRDLSLVPVYASLRLISQTIAISPIKLYEKSNKGRKELTDHNLTKLLKKPYKQMTYFNWMQMQCLAMVGRGNAYALIIRDINYEPIELIPLLWDSVYVVELTNSDDFYYQINFNGRSFSAWAEDILHFKPFSEDGKRGVNPIELHRATLDSATNEALYTDNFYKQAANISGVIESPKRMDKAAIALIKDGFAEKYGGVENTGKTAVIGDGATYKQIKLISPMDANYIETAKLTRADIGVIFGVPLNKLGDLSQATFSNITEMNRDFYKTTLAPYFVCIAQEIDNKLLKESEKSKNYSEFDADILLSAAKKERFETHAIGIRNGIVSRNEVREYENLETKEGLDEMLQESGVMTTSQADRNFNNSGGDEGDNEINSDDIKATAKSINDFKSELGRVKDCVNSLAITSGEKD